jgi:hypothetical protein
MASTMERDRNEQRLSVALRNIFTARPSKLIIMAALRQEGYSYNAASCKAVLTCQIAQALLADSIANSPRHRIFGTADAEFQV